MPRAALAVAVAFAIGSGAVSVSSASRSPATPQSTVRDFLTAAVVNGDGVTANRYLTPRARHSFHDAVSAPSAEVFFTGDDLDLGGLVVNSDARLAELHYRVVRARAERRVEVSHGAAHLWFTLRPATAGELARFMAPPTPWRIDSSVASLGSLPGAAPGRTAPIPAV